MRFLLILFVCDDLASPVDLGCELLFSFVQLGFGVIGLCGSVSHYDLSTVEDRGYSSGFRTGARFSKTLNFIIRDRKVMIVNKNSNQSQVLKTCCLYNERQSSVN